MWPRAGEHEGSHRAQGWWVLSKSGTRAGVLYVSLGPGLVGSIKVQDLEGAILSVGGQLDVVLRRIRQGWHAPPHPLTGQGQALGLRVRVRVRLGLRVRVRVRVRLRGQGQGQGQGWGWG